MNMVSDRFGVSRRARPPEPVATAEFELPIPELEDAPGNLDSSIDHAELLAKRPERNSYTAGSEAVMIRA
ncbi:asparagine synthetase [Colletotrichum higginsianum]|nr:asparagine synthetase [Colletotrichum higginsianum]